MRATVLHSPQHRIPQDLCTASRLESCVVRAAVMGQARLTFDDRHERVAKSDGTASTCRVMKVKLLETP